ncbi:hypothetical protein [Succinivibrio dextrinosolvens]|uniref:hypothetical protein n=1 Tax=Succinivibrio dextrinosolvens TaxID=83771 RepID=UPI00241FF574|nr:hypothetical protein [Succinivibrio dextrinosolvens]MBE6422905.1 hypothetical protein [Succinivibrio dextrinosolvens]
MSRSVIESFLKGQNVNLDNYFTSIRNCWFLNSNPSEIYNIKCLQQKFYQQYFVCVCDEKERLVPAYNISSETSLFGTWSALLVKIFDVRYVVKRTDNGFLVMFGNEDQSNIFINVKHISSVCAEYESLRLKDYAVISRTAANRLTIGSYSKIREVVAGRVIMLLLLAYSFSDKFNDDYKLISTLKNTESKLNLFFKNNKIKKIISQSQNFKNDMISYSPFKENQVHDLEQIWLYLNHIYHLNQKTNVAYDRIQSLCVGQDRMYDRRGVFYAVLAVIIGFAGLVQNYFS